MFTRPGNVLFKDGPPQKWDLQYVGVFHPSTDGTIDISHKKVEDNNPSITQSYGGVLEMIDPQNHRFQDVSRLKSSNFGWFGGTTPLGTPPIYVPIPTHFGVLDDEIAGYDLLMGYDLDSDCLCTLAGSALGGMARRTGINIK